MKDKLLQGTKRFLSKLFIDGLSGMALGLFSTLIVGTILAQIGAYIPGAVGEYIVRIGTIAKAAMGVGIGCGVAIKYKSSPLLTISAAVCGMAGAYAARLLSGELLSGAIVTLNSPGEPLGAFIAAFVGIEIGALIAGKTKIDIILTPIVTILAGGAAGLLVGPPVSRFMAWLGGIINFGAEQQPILMGIIVAVAMGIFLTLPISSAAIGVALSLSGIAAGAATVGCCANMIGFAVISYRENKMGGLLAQGLGTSMLQMPNIVKKPIIWLPVILSSAILGPISAVLGLTGNAVGSGMGTAGLVGPIMTFSVMTEAGSPVWQVLLLILLMLFILPAALSLLFSEIMRKLGWIKLGDMKLDA